MLLLVELDGSGETSAHVTSGELDQNRDLIWT